MWQNDGRRMLLHTQYREGCNRQMHQRKVHPLFQVSQLVTMSRRIIHPI